MIKRKISLFQNYWDDKDIQLVSESIREGKFWALGPNIISFEKKICKFLGVKYAVTFNSGTSALHAALLAHGIEKNDEVIVPSFTFIAVANAPLFVGAKPIFADIEDTTFGLNPEDVEKKITKKTKAIIAAHYGGSPCKIRELRTLAQKNNIILIEDAAETFGAHINKKKIGTYGACSILSFCANKIISTGEGGAVVTGSKKSYEKLRLLRSHGMKDTTRHIHKRIIEYRSLGYNFRMSNLTAALGVSQLSKVNKILRLRREKATYLSRQLSTIDEIVLPSTPEGFYRTYQMFTVRVNENKRDRLVNFLKNNGIETKIYFRPIHQTYFYKKILHYKDKLPITEKISSQVLTLPMHPLLTVKEIDYIVLKIKKFFREKK